MTVSPEAPRAARPLRPSFTLREVLGEGVVFVARRSPNLLGWSPPLPGQVDFQTGIGIGIAGGMPYVACTATSTPAILDVLTHGGLPCDAELHRYRTASEYLALIARLRASGLRLSTQRVHPHAETPAKDCTVAPTLQEDLNDKGKMAEWVPERWLAPRRVVAVRDLPAASELLGDGEPVVLKAATPLPSGGGHCVWVCRTPSDVERARAALASEARVVIETFLHLRRTVCVHANVAPDGRVAVVGVAEEVVDAEGRWRGNWLDERGDDVPAGVLDVVARIAAAGAASGYRGILGVDVGLLDDGLPRVLDLNFRWNGSTPAAWLRASILKERGARVMRAKGWSGASDYASLERAVRAAIERGTLVPLGLYDPAACEMGGVPRVAGLLIGASRDAVEDEDCRLAAEGLR